MSQNVKTPVEFWYEFASTYSYPAAMRIERAAEAAGVEIVWRPFWLGPVMFEQQGLRDSPFNVYPVKGRYMWRDLERICAQEGIPFARPEVFPQNGLKAARLALVGERDGWVAPFSRAVYRANFAEGRTISDDDVLGGILTALDLDPDTILAQASSPGIKDALRQRSERAVALGMFGAPNFLVGDELFWGNDRLEQALAWAKR